MAVRIVMQGSMRWTTRAIIVVAIVLITDLLLIHRRPGNQSGSTTSDKPTGSTSKALTNSLSHSTHPAEGALPWRAPDSTEIPSGGKGDLIRYGKELVANTARYLGPKGKVAALTNGMNCQNCHLEAGTRLYGNNYSAVFATYPKFRERSGTIENIYKRVNDCLERSLNGKSLDTNSREMQAFSSYINWVGHHVPVNTRPAGAGITDLPFLTRAADPGKGWLLYTTQCQRCHGPEGEGMKAADSNTYVYPPLWGVHSYTTGAGLYRISRLAGYIKDNMPFGASHQQPQLTDEEAWDIAAFVNSRPRPEKKFKGDWPVLSGKPVDHPFGPYVDSFSERQHKFGPFGPIRAADVMAKTHSKIMIMKKNTGAHRHLPSSDTSRHVPIPGTARRFPPSGITPRRLFSAIIPRLQLLGITRHLPLPVIIAALLLITTMVHAQAVPYKVVFDMTSKDTINQQSLIRELGLIRDANPDASLEVVLYGQGLDLVIKDRSSMQPAVQKLIMDKKVAFKVCAMSMKRLHIDDTQLLAGVETVPDGIYEIISKQQGGWGYIKVGH